MEIGKGSRITKNTLKSFLLFKLIFMSEKFVKIVRKISFGLNCICFGVILSVTVSLVFATPSWAFQAFYLAVIGVFANLFFIIWFDGVDPYQMKHLHEDTKKKLSKLYYKN